MDDLLNLIECAHDAFDNGDMTAVADYLGRARSYARSIAGPFDDLWAAWSDAHGRVVKAQAALIDADDFARSMYADHGD